MSEYLNRVGAVALIMVSSVAAAQDLVGASTTVNGVSTLVVIDPVTGATRPFMTVPIPANYELYNMTAPPGCGLSGIVSRTDNANNRSRLLQIDPLTEASTMLEFTAPLNASYAEGFEYSPRHGALLISYGPFGNFGTTRLALVDLNGVVQATAGPIAGVTDLDTFMSSATLDIFMDLNRTSNPRVVQLATLFPNPTVTAFASPPSMAGWHDGAMHPTTGEIIFLDSPGTRLIRLVGNAYVNGATLQGGFALRGLAYATLPPNISTGPDGVETCPLRSATLTVEFVGTGSVAVTWEAETAPGSGVWNPLTSGGPGPSGTSTVTISDAPGMSSSAMMLTNASVGDSTNYRCILANACGTITSPPAAITVLTCCSDVNCDGVPDQDDVACLVLAVAGDMSCFCDPDPDFNHDGVPDQGDIADLILVVAGAPCP